MTSASGVSAEKASWTSQRNAGSRGNDFKGKCYTVQFQLKPSLWCALTLDSCTCFCLLVWNKDEKRNGFRSLFLTPRFHHCSREIKFPWSGDNDQTDAGSWKLAPLKWHSVVCILLLVCRNASYMCEGGFVIGSACLLIHFGGWPVVPFLCGTTKHFITLPTVWLALV